MKTLFLRNLMLACLLGAITYGTSAADTLEVGPGKTYTTIQTAVDAANGGDTILIDPGTYNETVIVANFDSNGDYDYDDPGDKDYSGLRIIGAGADPSQVVVKPHTTQFSIDGVRYEYIRPFDPEGVNDPSYSYKAGFLFNGQRIGSGTEAETFSYNPSRFPYYGFMLDAQQYTYYRNYFLTNGGAPITGIELANLTVDTADTGVYLNGYYTDATIRDCVFVNNNVGVRYEGGTQDSSILNNTFTNNKTSIILRDEVFDVDVVNNTITLDANFEANNPFYRGDNVHKGIFLWNSNNARGEVKAARNQVTRNTIDFTAYTGDIPSVGLLFMGGRDLVLDNNFISGASTAATTDSDPWYVLQEGVRIEGWELSDNYTGIKFDVHTENEISRVSFTDFAQQGVTPPVLVDDAVDYYHLPCDSSLGGQQFLRRQFKVPATGTTTLSMKTWFSENGLTLLNVYEVGNPAGALPIALTSTYSGVSSPLPDQHFAPTGFGPSRVTTRNGGATMVGLSSCSGSYTTTDPGFDENFRTVDYTGVPGTTRDGDTIDLTLALPPEFNDQDVVLEWVHYPYYAPAHSCEINGSEDWCGFYFSEFLVTNTVSGVLSDSNGIAMDETTTINPAGWQPDTLEVSFALAFYNEANAADYADVGPVNEQIFINQNDFSNPWGDAIVFNDDLPTDPTKTATVVNNSFFDNAGFALNNLQTSPVDAEQNWWNSNNGPTISTNPGGDGEFINDPAGSVDFTPFTRGLFTATVDGAAFGTGTTSGGSGYSIEFLDGDRDILLGTLAADGTFSAGGTSPGGPLLLRITGASIPAFEVGDYLDITLGSDTFRAYLPPNEGGLYGNNLLLWIDSEGSTYFYCDDTNRNCAFGDGNAQSPTVARNSGDLAQKKGFLTFDFINNAAGSDFNWYGQTHFTSDIADSTALFDTLNAQYFAEGGTDPNGLVRTLSRWNAASQSYVQYVRRPFISGNFPLELGGAYRVETTDDHRFVLEGAEPQRDSLSFTLFTTQSTNQNWFSIPWYKTDLVYASDLSNDVDNAAGSPGAVATVNSWNPVSQSFTQYINNASFGPTTDFDVNRGQAVRVDLDDNVVGSSTSFDYDAVFQMPSN